MAIIGAGTQLLYCATSGGTYTALAKMDSFKPGEMTVAKVPVECFDNTTLTNGLPVTDAIPGWVDTGPYTSKLKYLKTQYGVLRGLLGTPYFWKVIFPDGSGEVFPGFLSKLGREVPLKETITCEVEIVVTGAAIAVFSAAQS